MRLSGTDKQQFESILTRGCRSLSGALSNIRNNKISPVFLALILLFCSSCQTYVTSSGKKHRQLFPATDKAAISAIDTGKYLLLPFSAADRSNRLTHKNGKRVVQMIRPSDVVHLAESKESYIIYLWDSKCPATQKKIHTLDSICGSGVNVIVASMRYSCEAMDVRLRNTNFSRHPLYIIAPETRSGRLLVRKVSFLKQCCPTCYDKYKDDLALADYLYLANGTVTAVMYTDKGNVLSR
ncbi:MAG: hypothetical protein IAE95_14485 [Chitinophagaceae bacterium]|nr:hypothetical protein [Chitinophagaceae bacterium]